MSVYHVNRVCLDANHFWYPEIKKHLEELANDSTISFVEKINFKALEIKVPTGKCSITLIVQKIFHQIRLFFSHKYRVQFKNHVKILVESIEKKEVATKIWKYLKRSQFIKRENKRVDDKLSQIKESIETRKIQEMERYRAEQCQLKKDLSSILERITIETKGIKELEELPKLLLWIKNSYDQILEIEEEKNGLTYIFNFRRIGELEKKQSEQFEIIREISKKVHQFPQVSDQIKQIIANPINQIVDKDFLDSLDKEIDVYKDTIEAKNSYIKILKEEFEALGKNLKPHLRTTYDQFIKEEWNKPSSFDGSFIIV